MARIPTYIALTKFYEGRTAEVKEYFEHLPKIIGNGIPYEVSIAYVFLKTEQAQNRALYGGVVKVHRANSEFASRIMNYQHLTRDGFQSIYKNVFGHALGRDTNKKIAEAEKVRDKVIHGKNVPENELREAIADVLEYAELFNEDVSKAAGFKPFGSMKGFKGRAEPLDVRTTKWLMRGLGFGVKA
jgi:hypothetical protein